MSLNALNTMAVEDMDSIPPRKIQLVCEKPIALPAVYPRNIMPQTMITVENMAEAPTLISFLNEKSSPMANRRKITPISAHNTGHNISHYDRLSQPFENDGYDTGYNQDSGKV